MLSPWTHRRHARQQRQGRAPHRLCSAFLPLSRTGRFGLLPVLVGAVPSAVSLSLSSQPLTQRRIERLDRRHSGVSQYWLRSYLSALPASLSSLRELKFSSW